MARVFQWERFFQENRIEYVTKGANVSRGEINIRCPWCGSADPSHHMGLNLETGFYSCWRNRSQHSGKSPLRLIIKLLGVSYEHARRIAGLSEDYVDPDGFDALAAKLLSKNKNLVKAPPEERRFLHFSEDMVPITDKLRTRRHWNYLYQRGFNHTSKGVEDVDRLVADYDLRAVFMPTEEDGWKWENRIIVPFFQDKELVTWTARAIGHSNMRYRDLEIKDSILGPKFTLYNHDCIIKGGRVLILQEGPFDVLKVDFYGKAFGVRSVGLATNSMTEAQAILLAAAEDAFEHIYVAMDTKTQLGIVDSMRMSQNMAFLKKPVKITGIPFGAGDGGNMTYEQVRAWCAML